MIFLAATLLLLLTSPTFQQTTTTTTTEEDEITTPRSTNGGATNTEGAKVGSGKEDDSGDVAFIVGSTTPSFDVELYSPDGTCQHNLAPLPISVMPNPILFMGKGGRIIVCADTVYAYENPDYGCWSYDAKKDKWSRFPMNASHERTKRFGKPAVYVDGVLFIIDSYYPEAYNIETDQWVTWPKPINASSIGACLIHVNKSLILLGGVHTERSAQMYDIERNEWSVLASPPMDIRYSGCALLPNNKILVLGSEYVLFRHKAALYDIETNSWKSLGDTKYDRLGTSLVVLGERVFAIGGGIDYDVNVEEYNFKDDVWLIKYEKPYIRRRSHATLAVPASMFQHRQGGCEGIKKTA